MTEGPWDLELATIRDISISISKKFSLMLIYTYIQMILQIKKNEN